MHKPGALLFTFLFTLFFISTAAAAQTWNLAVTPEGYDKMGHILTNLGYSYTEISLDDLGSLSTLSQYDVIFINCDSMYMLPETAASAIKSYVDAGGIVYASDWAYEPINDAFDSAITFLEEDTTDYWDPRQGESGIVTADVVDPGLAAYLGSSTAEIYFDLGMWVVIDSVPSGTRQYLSGHVDVYDYDTYEYASTYVPITVAFDSGAGTVIYTSFHYDAQEDDLTQKLMQYLVFKAVTETFVSDVEEALVAEDFEIDYDIRDAIDQDETKTYDVEITGGENVRIVIDWAGSSLGLSVQGPDGATYTATGTKPKYVSIENAAAGTYTISVTGDDVPSDNEPFVLAVGTGGTLDGGTTDDGTTPPGGDGDSTTTQTGDMTWLIIVIVVVVIAVALVAAFKMGLLKM